MAVAVPFDFYADGKGDKESKLETVNMHCHGPSTLSDFVPNWFRSQHCVTASGSDQELLKTYSYGGVLTWRGLLLIFLCMLPFTWLWDPGLPYAVYESLVRVWDAYKPETRTGWEIYQDEKIFEMWQIAFQIADFVLSCAPCRYTRDVQMALERLWDSWFAPPPPFPWARIGSALCLLTGLIWVSTLLMSIKNHVTYVMSGRYNATTTIVIERGLYDHLEQDKTLRPRLGMAGDKVPASLLSAARYAVNTYDTSGIASETIENTLEYYLQQRLIRAIRAERFRPNTQGLPHFRR
jgi:hypothetical protein